MVTRKRYLSIVILLCAALMPTLQGEQTAQSTAPTGVLIDGTIVDSAKGVLPGVRVTLAQGNTVLATTVSNSSGKFQFDQIKTGTYTVTAVLAGFKTSVTTITISAVSGVIALPITLELGAISEAVSVTASSELVRSSRNQLTFLQGVSSTITTDGIRAIQHQVHGALPNTEAYAHLPANPFRLTTAEPLSTFAADVDSASYSNVRRFLAAGQLPPPDAVRVEEFVNYFRFDYPAPRADRPVSVTTQVGECPWAPAHKLALIGVRARPIDERATGGRNLVLLLDVSGSMASPDKLPLVQTAMRMFVDTLRDTDRIAIVTYAGSSGLALPSTPARNRERIHDAIEHLRASGSTNGADGIRLAYQTARAEFVPQGVNRVILATDGDFNVGVTSEQELLRLIEEERQSGIFLSVLGVGTGNLKDAKMELLADKGNGHYAYLDSLQEARRVLVREGGATLETVAKDVKFQIEFNPAHVAAWKLIGYENRLLAHEAFNDDTKDAGDLGAGHTVTVLYEIVPVGTTLPATLTHANGKPLVDPLIYQVNRTAALASPDVFTVKVRYKLPAAAESALITQAVRPGGAATELAFAAAVAEFGLLLREPAAGAARWSALATRVRALQSPNQHAAERQSFGDLVELAAGLKKIR